MLEVRDLKKLLAILLYWGFQNLTCAGRDPTTTWESTYKVSQDCSYTTRDINLSPWLRERIGLAGPGTRTLIF